MNTARGTVVDTAIKALAQNKSYTYNARTGRYHETGTNKMVSFEKAMSVFDTKERVDAAKLQALATLYKEGKIPAGVWYQGTFDMLRRYHVQQAAHGAGGFGRLSIQDFKRITEILEEDKPRLLKFGEQLPLMGDGQIQYRLNLYLGNGRREYWRARRLPGQSKRPGYTTIERRVLLPGDNCEWCLKLADFGWQPYGVLPYPGEIDQSWYGHACLTNCRCKMERRYIKTENLGKYVKVPYVMSAPPEKAWDEAQHPRDEQGRFTEAGSTSAYAPEVMGKDPKYYDPTPWSDKSVELASTYVDTYCYVEIPGLEGKDGGPIKDWAKKVIAAHPPEAIKSLMQQGVRLYLCRPHTYESAYQKIAGKPMDARLKRSVGLASYPKELDSRGKRKNPFIMVKATDTPDGTWTLHHEIGHTIIPPVYDARTPQQNTAYAEWFAFAKRGGDHHTRYSQTDPDEFESFCDSYASYISCKGTAKAGTSFAETFDAVTMSLMYAAETDRERLKRQGHPDVPRKVTLL